MDDGNDKLTNCWPDEKHICVTLTQVRLGERELSFISTLGPQLCTTAGFRHYTQQNLEKQNKIWRQRNGDKT